MLPGSSIVLAVCVSLCWLPFVGFVSVISVIGTVESSGHLFVVIAGEYSRSCILTPRSSIPVLSSKLRFVAPVRPGRTSTAQGSYNPALYFTSRQLTHVVSRSSADPFRRLTMQATKSPPVSCDCHQRFTPQCIRYADQFRFGIGPICLSVCVRMEFLMCLEGFEPPCNKPNLLQLFNCSRRFRLRLPIPPRAQKNR